MAGTYAYIADEDRIRVVKNGVITGYAGGGADPDDGAHVLQAAITMFTPSNPPDLMYHIPSMKISAEGMLIFPVRNDHKVRAIGARLPSPKFLISSSDFFL